MHSDRRTNNSIIIHYMTVRFSINILLTTMSTILPIFIMTDIMVIYCYSADAIYITYKAYYELPKTYVILEVH